MQNEDTFLPKGGFGTFWWVRFDQIWVRFGKVRFGLGMF